MLFSRLAIVAGMIAWLPPCALAQCDGPGTWAPGDGTIAGIDGAIHAFCTDGERLYAAGIFSSIGGIPASDVAFFDNGAWHALGAGMDHSGVYALATFEGSLYAGGRFRNADNAYVGRIARWDGTGWRRMSSGIDGGPESLIGALTVYQDELIVGGSFTSAGGVQALSVARWSGSAWQAMPEGFTGAISGQVTALVAFNGQLIAGGNFDVIGSSPLVTNIARWSGTGWEALYPSTPSGIVGELAVYHGELIAAGVLVTPTATPCIMHWDGTAWVALGGGVTQGSHVSALAVVGDELIVSGGFTAMGGMPLSRVARWDGTAWHAMGEGTDADVYALHALGTGVLVSGPFQHAGGAPIAHFARWTPPARACAADFDCSGQVNSGDLFAYLGAFFGGGPADFNGDGAINSQDFLDFLVAFFGGC